MRARGRSAFRTCLWAWVWMCLPASYAIINNSPLRSHLLHILFIIVLSKNNTVSSRDFWPTGGFRRLCGLPFGYSWISSCRFQWGRTHHELNYKDNARYLICISDVLMPCHTKAMRLCIIITFLSLSIPTISTQQYYHSQSS